MNCIDYYYHPNEYNFLKYHSIAELGVGDIVYFYSIGNSYNSNIWFGVLKDICTDGVILELYSPDLKPLVKINEIEYEWQKAPDKTEPIKLPKSGKKRSEILNDSLKPQKYYSDINFAKELQTLFFSKEFLSNKETILKAIKEKNIIPNSKIEWTYYEAFFPDNNTLIYAKKYPSYQSRYYAFQTNERTLSWDKIFLTYEEISQYALEIELECARKKSLTDSESVKEEVATYVTKYIDLYLRLKDIDLCKEIHEKIMESIDKLLKKLKIDWYDFEIRLYSGNLQYKKAGNVKWNNLIDTDEFCVKIGNEGVLYGNKSNI